MRKKDAYKVLLIAMAAVLWGNNPLRVDATESEPQYEILEESGRGQMESVYIDQSGSTITTTQEDMEMENEMVEEAEPEAVQETTYGDHTIPGLEDYQDANKKESVDQYGEAVLETEALEGTDGWNGDDFDYTGPLDERTGKPLTTTVTNDGGGVYIMGKDDYHFNSKTGRYEILCGEMSVGFDVPPETLLSYGEKFNVYVPMGITMTIYYNGELLDDDSVVTSATIESKVLELTQNNEFILNSQNEGILDISKLSDNFYVLSSVGVSNNLQNLIINVSSNNPQFNETISIDIKAVSMLG